MTLGDMLELTLKGHLADKKVTTASVGVIYGMMIAAKPDNAIWPKIHRLIRARLAPDADDAKWLTKLDAVKQCGWRLHDAMAEIDQRGASHD